jgi:hypothetical protein
VPLRSHAGAPEAHPLVYVDRAFHRVGDQLTT